MFIDLLNDCSINLSLSIGGGGGEQGGRTGNVWGDVDRLPATLLDIHSKSEMVGGAGDGRALEEQEDKIGV